MINYFKSLYKRHKFDSKSYLSWELDEHPLTWRQIRCYYVTLLMVSPTLLMIGLLQFLRDIWVSIALFHITVVLGSTLYMVYYDKVTLCKRKDNSQSIPSSPSINQEKEPLLINIDNVGNNADQGINIKQQQGEKLTWQAKVRMAFKSRLQYRVGVFLFINSVGIGMILYYVLAKLIPNVAIKIEDYGLLKYHTFPLYFFFVYFSLVNPIVEEWFWRIFLVNTFGSTKKDKLIITFFYTLYHMVVLLIFFKIWVCLIFLIFVFIGGALFMKLTHHFGPVVSIMAHMAADTLIVFIISNMYWHWYPYWHMPISPNINIVD